MIYISHFKNVFKAYLILFFMDEDFKKLIAENSKIDNLEEMTDNATLDSLGADSLDIVEISMEIEDKYKMMFPEDYKPTTLGELWKYVEEHKGK